jgi:hypothetical protein
MKTITAIEKYEKRSSDEIFTFLAGGITNCKEWQNAVLNKLNEFEIDDNLIIFNPRRKNFPINDPTASLDQIRWEFEYLEQCDIFSIYFDGPTQSDQPICFYELGRNLERMKTKFPENWDKRIIITVNYQFKRTADVVIQTMLASNSKIKVNVFDNFDESIEYHANAIKDAFMFLKGENE